MTHQWDVVYNNGTHTIVHADTEEAALAEARRQCAQLPGWGVSTVQRIANPGVVLAVDALGAQPSAAPGVQVTPPVAHGDASGNAPSSAALPYDPTESEDGDPVNG